LTAERDLPRIGPLLSQTQPSVARWAASDTSEEQQKDNLCGPFQAARVLRDAGVTEFDGAALDQDLVARIAGTRLPNHEVGPQVPAGALNFRDYRFDLERWPPEDSGTSPAGLAQAIEELSGGGLVCVPLCGPWRAAKVEVLLDRAGAAGARLLANLRTGPLWGSRPPIEALLAALDGCLVPDSPAAEWDVGHYVELVQVVRGRRGSLVLVRDSYPSLGWQGHHLQPPAALGAALMRGDGRGGGVLAVLAPGAAPTVRALAAELGLETEMWDN
jgi:hypothetical protein